MAIDKRWRGSILIPITVLLFIFSIVLVGLCAVASDPYGFNVFALVVLAAAVVTIIHTLVDISLYFTSKLNPLYLLILSCLHLAFWLSCLVIGCVDLSDVVNYCEPYGYYDDFDFNDSAPSRQALCVVPKARLSFTIFVFLLYIPLVALSAITYKRDQKVRFEKNVNKLIAKYFSTDPPAMASPGYEAGLEAKKQDAPTPATSGVPSHGIYDPPKGIYNHPEGIYYNPDRITEQDKIVSGVAEGDTPLSGVEEGGNKALYSLVEKDNKVSS